VWAKTSGGKNMPLDPEPVSDGNIVRGAFIEAGRAVFTATPYNAEHHAGHKRYRSHFVTCPNAAEHRRSR
jgi:hypothetical protein